jgi:tRNA pseudouridine13 synthase
MALVRKRGLTTVDAVERIRRALDLPREAAGYAGQKDKHGVTTQWLSFAGTRPEALRALAIPGIEVLEAGLHRNKLRIGHHRGNRFVVTLRGVVPEARARAEAILAKLAASGLPNFFGAQRFGGRGDNAERGLAILLGTERPPREHYRLKLLLSSLQSHFFNGVLARRLAGGTTAALLGGEVLQRTDSGGLFVSDDAAKDGERLAAGELVITGPICGPRMPWPKEGSPARAVEEEVLSAGGVTPEAFARFGRLARGGRRPLVVPVEGATVEEVLEASAIRLRFGLPPGAYATVLLDEITKS